MHAPAKPRTYTSAHARTHAHTLLQVTAVWVGGGALGGRGDEVGWCRGTGGREEREGGEVVMERELALITAASQMIGGDVPTDVMEMMMMTAAKVMKQAFEVK